MMLFSDLSATVELKSGELGGVRERKASSEGFSPRPLLPFNYFCFLNREDKRWALLKK
jgi:hypothetical protein